MKVEPTKEWCQQSAEIEGDTEVGCGYSDNPFYKPAGTHKPVVDPVPIYKLTPQERFQLMTNPKVK